MAENFMAAREDSMSDRGCGATCPRHKVNVSTTEDERYISYIILTVTNPTEYITLIVI